MNIQKQQLKHEHRDRLVQIGIRAVEHAMRFEPSEQAKNIIEQGLAGLRSKDALAVNKVACKLTSREYTKDNVLLQAIIELCRLAVTEKYVSGQMLNSVLIRCWDAGIFLKGLGIGNREMHAEMDWQTKNLDPLIKQSFEQLWEQEKFLKKSK